MRRITSTQTQASPLHDITLLLAMGFAVLFVLAVFYVNPIAKLGKVDPQAEFIITVTWPHEMDDDVDVWISAPNDKLTWFASKDNAPVLLDRDDRGSFADRMTINGKSIIIPLNQEIVTIRDILPGEYIFNLHMYNKSSREPTPVEFKIEKVNPTIKLVFITETPTLLTRTKEEVTIVRLVIGIDGTVESILTGPHESLISRDRSLN